MVCSSFGHCHALVMNTGASKMDQNQVTMAGSVWGRNSSRKFFSTTNHINANRKTWFRAVLTPAIPSLNRFCRYCSRKKFPWKIFRPLKIFKLLQAQFWCHISFMNCYTQRISGSSTSKWEHPENCPKFWIILMLFFGRSSTSRSNGRLFPIAFATHSERLWPSGQFELSWNIFSASCDVSNFCSHLRTVMKTWSCSVS